MATTPVAVTVPAQRNKKSTKPEKHTIQITFSTEEDIQLFTYLEEQAKADRRPLPLYVLLALHDALGKAAGTE